MTLNGDLGLWRVCSAFLYDDHDHDDGDDDWLIAGSLQVQCSAYSLCVRARVLFTGCSAKGVACGGSERHVICLNRPK